MSGESTPSATTGLKGEHYDGRLAGYCPMGCGQTLFVGLGGFITCSYVDCRRPDAVPELLVDEYEHLVNLGEGWFSVQHPLRERLDGLLFDCDLHQWMTSRSGPPGVPGLYRVRQVDRRWVFGEVVHSKRRDREAAQAAAWRPEPRP